MAYASIRAIKLVMTLLVCTAVVPGTALAHSHEAPGEHVKEFERHIGDYEQEVAALVARLDRLAARYGDGKDRSAEVDALIDAWEEVEFHEALERKAALLYPPIWQALIPLREAVKSGAAPEEVAKLTRQASVALHEGMGGLKLMAQMAAGSGMAGHRAAKDADAASTLSRINTLLDQSAQAYASGDTDESKALVHRAYMNHFEGIEGMLIEQDPDLVSRLEADFNATLPNLMDKGASPEAVRREIQRIRSSLDQAAHLLERAQAEKPKVF